MKVYVATARLALLAALAASASVTATATASATGRCDAPFKTLSSDCRGAPYDAKTLCLVLDQRTDQPTPCKTGSVPNKQTECAMYTGEQCDVLSYKVQYEPGMARFQIRFSRQGRRRLGDSAVAPPPPARHLSPASATGSAAAGTPTGTPTGVPNVLRVDRPDTPTVPPTRTPRPDPEPTRVNMPTTPSAPPSGERSTPPPTVVTTSPSSASGSGTGQPPKPPTPPPRSEVPISAKPVPGPVTGPNGDGTSNSAESNQFVDAIGPLALDPSLKELRIVGGTSEFGARGTVVEVRIDPQMLAKSPFVDSLWIANCNVGEQLVTGHILSGMPSGLNQLILRNTLLKAEPKDLSALQNLRSLEMSQNFLTTLSNKVSLPKLQSLDMSDNVLTSIEAYLPAVESLYLKTNKLNTIPSVVYSMRKLQELQLAENPISAIVVSSSQYAFLEKLHVTIDKPPVTPRQPVLYVPGPLTGPLPADITNLVLSSKNADLTNAVAVKVGTLMDLKGVFPVWKLPDAIYEVFRTQQELITKAQITVGGTEVESYLTDVATDTAAAASSSSSGATTRTDKQEQSSTSSPQDAKAGDVDINGQDGGAVNASRDAPTTDSTTASTKASKNHTTMIVSLGVVGVIAMLLVGLLFARHRRRTSRVTKANDDSVSALTTPRDGSSTASYQVVATSKRSDRDSMEYFGTLVPSGDDARLRDLFTSRRVRVNDLEDIRTIGSGTTSVVWLVKMRGNRDLASKRLIQSASTNVHMAKYVNEVVIAADLDHPSIVQLVGVAWTNETDLQALYEYMPNGDLQTHLQNNTTPASLSWSASKLQMAIDIVEALVYTHSFNPPLLHRDLRTRNVLLDDEMRPKLSNFGSARFASEQNTMTASGVGSARWLAPEILSGSTDYDHTSDMYAFGVLLCELDTHSSPYEDVRDINGQLLTETALMERVARGELRPSLSPACPPEVGGVVSRCLSQNPLSRPSAMQVAYEFRLLVRDLQQMSNKDYHREEAALR